MSTARAHPSWKAPTVSMPLIGNQPSLSEKTTMAISPTQKMGVA